MEENKEEVIKQETKEEVKETEVIKNEETKKDTKEAEVVTDKEQKEDKKLNSSALASFICSLVGLLICGLPLGIAAIITGANGLTSFKPDKENNKWMAITGLCLGIVDVICVIIYMTTVYGK